MKTLVTDGIMKKSLAAVRAISGGSEEVGVASRYPISMAGVSKHADGYYRVDFSTPEDYVRSLNDIVTDHDYDQILPIGGRTFEILSEYRSQIETPIEKLLPPQGSMRITLNKKRVNEIAADIGVPVPETVTPENESQLEEAAAQTGFPAVLKTSHETEQRFVEVVDSLAELRAAYGRYTDQRDSEPLVQEYLPGRARGHFGLYIDGESVAGYTHTRIRETPPSGGASSCAESSQNDDLKSSAEALLSELNWRGVAMVEYKEASDGTPALVEINPKFWGSLDLAVSSGLNLPKMLLELTTDKTDFSYEFTPSRVYWPLSGDIAHLRDPRSRREFFHDVLSGEAKSNIRIDDPSPHVVELVKPIIGRFQ